MVGAGGARCEGSVLYISRLVIAPDLQGRGIGTRLLAALEQRAPAEVRRFTLFTGHLSIANDMVHDWKFLPSSSMKRPDQRQRVFAKLRELVQKFLSCTTS
ncbi:MAG: hypothetical protein DLM55_06155 [Acidimicrobiales bacterium]|nr:MAG: hypothetical protein DLM55_06155 [Acidimicrobiales bacterium]